MSLKKLILSTALVFGAGSCATVSSIGKTPLKLSISCEYGIKSLECTLTTPEENLTYRRAMVGFIPVCTATRNYGLPGGYSLFDDKCDEIVDIHSKSEEIYEARISNPTIFETVYDPLFIRIKDDVLRAYEESLKPKIINPHNDGRANCNDCHEF